MRLLTCCLCFTAITALLASPLSARGAPASSETGLSAEELKSILPLLRKFDTISLAESTASGDPKSMSLAVRINAPRTVAFKVFEDPSNFYYLSTLFKENTVLERHENSQAYSWASRHKWFSFTGINTIALFPPRRADVSIVKSSVGAGTFRLMFYEDGKDHTILVLTGVLDVQSSEWLIRFLLGGAPAMRQAMNVAIGLVIVKGAKALAERFAQGKQPDKHKTSGKKGGDVRPLGQGELAALEPLLKRGTVVLTQSVAGGRMAQAVAIEHIDAPAKKALVAAASPELYPKMIRAFTDVTVHERSEQGMTFSWIIGLSLFNIGSKNQLTFTPDGVLIKGLEGDLAGATWRWQILDRGADKCTVAYYGYAEIDKTGYILEKTLKREPYLEHGLMAGSNMVMLSAVRRALLAASSAPASSDKK